ncbi:cadherin-like protein 26 [Poecilia formosa]|uniref:Cadherin-like protein 26 n=1 Tax=Poecilia formosa TaxID=48698 RepID=A0A087XVC5_POEFO|nr:PREDICTED: cadherin-like protein 26 [Poecilia formosa]
MHLGLASSAPSQVASATGTVFAERKKERSERSKMRSLFLLLLVALASLGESKEGSEHHKRAKRESLSRSKRRWVLNTIELEEEMDVEYPYKITTMHNDKTANVEHHFEISVEDDDSKLFTINKTSGEVYVHRRLDREKTPSYHITFDVWDIGVAKKIDKELSFDVDVKDINDNAPMFISQFQKSYDVKENTKVGDYLPVLMDVVDLDQEGTINSTVDVTVVKQSPAEPKIGVKKITEKQHQLISEGCFDYDKAKHYSVVISASDRGKPPLSSTVAVELNVIDTNSHRPKFKKRQYEAEAVEMQTHKDILRVAVEDKDTPNTDGWRAKYSIISGNEDEVYAITTDPVTNEGIVGVVKAKNFDITTLVKLQIGVENVEPLTVCKDGKLIEDLSSLPPKDSVSITVKMVDTNDAPLFEKYTEEVYQTEESEKGQVLYTPKVKDAESDNIRYELVEDPANWVTVDEKTGIITTIEKMDRESPHVDVDSTYRIVIAAIDDGSPPATSTCTVSVHLRDINDNTPKLLNNSAILCSNEADKVMVRAKDADLEPFSGPFGFSLADDKTLKERWKIEPEYGEEVSIRLLTKLPNGNYSVPLVIQDKQNQPSKETLSVVLCNCVKPGVCAGPKPLSTAIGIAAIGLIIAALLVFLLLLLLLTRKQKTFLMTNLNDEYKQTLMKYNEEGLGTDCKAEPNILASKTTESITDGIKLGSMQNIEASPGMVQDMGSCHRTYSVMSSNMNTWDSQQQGGMKRNSRGSTWSSNRRGTFQGNSTFKRSISSWSDGRVSSLLDRRLTVTDSNPTDSSDDHVKMYQYEGNGNSCMSLDMLSSEYQQNDLSFLDDLGPQFKTLEKIIMENKSEVLKAEKSDI